jgi:Na+-driven multidrug efflux pump
MKQSNLLILNTVAIYGRMLLSVGFGVIATRLVFSRLGAADFGLNAVIGAGGSLLLILSDALVGSAQRHISYEIGKGEQGRLREVFSSSVALFAATACIMAAVGAALGPRLLASLSIPPGREAVARMCYGLTVGSLAVTCASTPFRAAFQAHQSIVVDSLLDLLSSVLNFMIAVALLAWPGDPLLGFSIGSALVIAAIAVVALIACLTRYPAMRPTLRLVSWADIRHMVSYASWGFLGSACYRLFMQGAAIALNVFFGPVANAGYALAMQLANYQHAITSPVARAVAPAIVMHEAKRDRNTVRRLALLCSKYQTLLALMMLVPLCLEIDTVLALWIRNPPPHAAWLTRWVLIGGWAALLTTGHQLTTTAHGQRLGANTLLLSAIHLVGLAIAVGLFEYTTAGPVALPCVVALMYLCSAPMRAWFMGSLIELPVGTWSRTVVVPDAVALAVSSVCGLAIHLALPPGLTRLAAVTVACWMMTGVVAWTFLFGSSERQAFQAFGSSFLHRLGVAYPRSS